MGWASGSGLAEEIWDVVRKHIPKRNRAEVARKIYREFEAHDADDWCLEEGSLAVDAGIFVKCEGCGTYVYHDETECWECNADMGHDE